MNTTSTVDRILEATIIGSFSRLGIQTRRALAGWSPPPRLDGAAVLVTGASSGIGRAAAVALSRLGAEVWLAARNRAGLDETARLAGPLARPVVTDIVDPAQVTALLDQVKETTGRLDGLIHNAGALLPEYRTGLDGHELTISTHVLAPFRLTWLARPLLAAAARPAVVTVSSGGMYTQRLDLDRLETGPTGFRGAVAYARAKRAQVVLSHAWARRLGVASHAMHPGWVRTPGLDSGLPGFTHLGPALRTPEEGADTAVWLVACSLTDPGFPPEGFWHDRCQRAEHYLPRTSGRPDDGERLWEWCRAQTGVG